LYLNAPSICMVKILFYRICCVMTLLSALLPGALPFAKVSRGVMYRQLLRVSMSSNPSGVSNPMDPNVYTEKAWQAVSNMPQYETSTPPRLLRRPIC